MFDDVFVSLQWHALPDSRVVMLSVRVVSPAGNASSMEMDDIADCISLVRWQEQLHGMFCHPVVGGSGKGSIFRVTGRFPAAAF